MKKEIDAYYIYELLYSTKTPKILVKNISFRIVYAKSG